MNPKCRKILSQGTSSILLAALLAGLLPGEVLPALAAAGDTVRASVDSGGIQGNGRSAHPDISGNGRYVAFESDSSNLVAGDTNGTSDIFVHDLLTGATTVASAGPGGVPAGGSSPAISEDGRFVAFSSGAADLVSGDTNGIDDIFVRDRQTGETSRISVASDGLESNGISDFPDISADGRFVAFNSEATNLVGSDTNGSEDVFVHDRVTGETIRASVDSNGAESNGGSGPAAISADGQRVAFSSGANNLVSGDTNGETDVFVHDLQTGATTRASVSSGGAQADGFGRDPAISGDGRFVAFASDATNLAGGDTLGFEYIYVHDLQTGLTTPEWQFTDGTQMIGNSFFPAISHDGRYVAFGFDDRGDGMAFFDIYLRDRQSGATSRVPVSVSGGAANDSSFGPSISGDGQFTAFWSQANNLVSGDTNGVEDIFVHEYGDEPGFPTVSSVVAIDPNPTTADQVTFTITFSEIVGGVDAGDFALTTTGSISGASVLNITGSGKTRTVTINTGSGDGSLRLDVVDNDSIRDSASIPLGGAGAGNGSFSTGEAYLIDKSFPMVTASLRLDPDPTAAASVRFAVTFSEEVSGVDGSDFVLSTSGGVSGAAVATVDGFGASYTVTVNTGTGNGTLRLDAVDDDSIRDAVNNPLGGTGAGNGNFTAGEAYTIDSGAPSVTSSLRADPDPTAADTVHFTVTFSEAVTGVDAGDFALAASGGITGAAITSTSGGGDTYTVAVGTGTGNGTLRLDVSDNDSIIDTGGSPLGGPGAGNGNFILGEAYTINKPTLKIISTSVRSNGTNDGWVLESGENSGQGGSKNSNAPTFNLGDDLQDRQYRSVLHFPTSYLPDNAVITMAILIIKKQGLVGTDPFGTHQNISIDIRSGPFGSIGPFGFSGLQLEDFQAPATQNSVGIIQNNSVGGWFWAALDTISLPIINRTGVTQLRLSFQTDDNDDLGDDYLLFYSGNHDVLAERPHLLIEYYVP